MNGITNDNDIIPTFDYTGKIRILESSNFEQSQQLKDQCREFVDSTVLLKKKKKKKSYHFFMSITNI